MAGQSSTASGTLSTSTSSFTVEQFPELVTPAFMQASWVRTPQVFPPPQSLLAVQTLAGLLLQDPVIGQQVCPAGQVGFGSAVQTTVLDRAHDPVASVVAIAPTQSPSQASPRPSLSRSGCGTPTAGL